MQACPRSHLWSHCLPTVARGILLCRSLLPSNKPSSKTQQCKLTIIISLSPMGSWARNSGGTWLGGSGSGSHAVAVTAKAGTVGAWSTWGLARHLTSGVSGYLHVAFCLGLGGLSHSMVALRQSNCLQYSLGLWSLQQAR